MEKYEIRSIENGFIYLYDKKKNTYCKIDYNERKNHFSEELVPPFFSYYYPYSNPDAIIFCIPAKYGSRYDRTSVDKFPEQLRLSSNRLQCFNSYPMPSNIKITEIKNNRVFDCGKILDLGNLLAETRLELKKNINKAVSCSTDANKPFICIGGDHSIVYDIIYNLDSKFSGLIIWDFDAHNDLYPIDSDMDHGNVFSFISQLPFVEKIIQIGSRGLRVENQIIDNGKVIRISKDNNENEQIKFYLNKYKSKSHYLSIDLDCLDPSIFPYVDYAVPDGYFLNEFLNYISMIIPNVVGLDIVEGNSKGDIHNGDYDIPLLIMITALSIFSQRN